MIKQTVDSSLLEHTKLWQGNRKQPQTVTPLQRPLKYTEQTRRRAERVVLLHARTLFLFVCFF